MIILNIYDQLSYHFIRPIIRLLNKIRYEVRAQTLGGETLPPESWILPTAAEAHKDQVSFSEMLFSYFSSFPHCQDHWMRIFSGVSVITPRYLPPVEIEGEI